MEKLISGIHHVTALAGDSQQNLDFYTGILGLRLVKKTVNFDAPEVYHFYYGNEKGEPGTILTFFPYEGIQKGRHGRGMLNVTSFSVASSALEFWEKRLEKYNVDFERPKKRFDEQYIYFQDPDGLGLELVFNGNDTRKGFSYGAIPVENAIKGFHNVEIWHETTAPAASLLTEVMDHQVIAEEGNRTRYGTSDAPGNYIDLVTSPGSVKGLQGGGTVHHIAFGTKDMQTQTQIRDKILKRGLNPTPAVDRQYFKSVYFREPGGVLFEIATAQPGFTVDEEPGNLGEGLKLPPQYEQHRSEIEKVVKPVRLQPEKYS